jgi:Tol biopolymer transport system component
VYTPLASGAFSTESLAWASDGKGFLVAGGGQILRYPLDGGSPLELLREGREADGIYPAPDGRAVYFTAPVNRVRSLLSVSAAGGKPELVYPLGGFFDLKGVAISPDGKWIVVSRFNEKGEGRLAYASPIGAPLQDYPHAIDWPATTRQVFRFSPDGKRLLLIAGWPPNSARPAEAYLIPWPPASAAPRKIPMQRNWWRMNAAWLPDGRNLLAMSSARFGSGYRLMLMGDDFQNEMPLDSGDTFDTRTVAMHVDGRALLAESTLDHNTVAIPLDGGPIRSLGSDFLDESFPSWMPDGEQYVQFINRRGNQQIWMMRKDGTPLRMLAGEINAAAGLAVSPDGRQIAFSADGVVYVVPVSGGTPIRIEEGSYPSWSPDSAFLVFLRGDTTRYQLRKIRLGASAKSEAFGVPEPLFDVNPVWSPDGRWIAVGGGAKVYLYSSDGKEKRVLETDPGRSMVWARDSRSLYHHRRTNELIQLTLDGKERVVRDLGEVRLRFQIPETMSVSPDGKTLLATERRSKTRVVLLEGLRAPRRIWERWLDGGAK